MRQTLLAHERVKAEEFGATDYQHLHIIPIANKELKNINTASGKLESNELHGTWANLLKSPDKYKMMDPKDFISPAKECRDTASPINYLEQRY